MRRAGRCAPILAMTSAMAPSSPWEETPVGGLARLVVHVVVCLGVVSCRVAPPVMGVRTDSPQASVKKTRSAGDGCGRRHGFMGR